MDVGSSNRFVFVDEIPVVDGRLEPEIAQDRNIGCLLPARIVRFVERSSFRNSIPSGVTQNEERVDLALGTPVGTNEVFSEDDLDGE